MTIILDGKKLAQKINTKVKNEISSKNIKPGLAVVLLGEDPASLVYVNNKNRTCREVGIESHSYELPLATTESELLELIEKLNKNININGILIQLPLPVHINKSKIIDKIDPIKDVDGFHPVNVGKLYSGEEFHAPCTPAGIMELLDGYDINVEAKHAVVVGASDIVGRPTAELLLRAGATLTACHDKTPDLKHFTKQADIVVSATGQKNLITKNMLKKNVVAIDVGINRDENGKIFGDIEKDLDKYAFASTPVPGGVGPMTIAMLMKNCLEAYCLQNK